MKYICLITLSCIITLACCGQSDSILRDEPIPDTVYVTKVLIEPGKVIYPKFLYRKGDRWYAAGRRVKPILYKLRDGTSDEWYHWPE